MGGMGGVARGRPYPPVMVRCKWLGTLEASEEYPLSRAERMAQVPPKAAIKGLPGARPSTVRGTRATSGAARSGSWVPGAWVRYDGPSASLDDRKGSINELCVGASAGHGFVLPPLEIRASLTPSVAVVT